MSEYIPSEWSRPKAAIDRIFDRMCDLRLEPNLQDVSSAQPGFARYREVALFEHHVEAFHRRMSRTKTTSPETTRQRRFHVAHEDAREGVTDYAFYNLPDMPVSFMTYNAVNSQGQTVVGERLTVFDVPGNPFLPSAILTRANRHLPDSRRGALIPTGISDVTPRQLYDIDTRLAHAQQVVEAEAQYGPLRSLEPSEH